MTTHPDPIDRLASQIVQLQDECDQAKRTAAEAKAELSRARKELRELRSKCEYLELSRNNWKRRAMFTRPIDSALPSLTRIR